MLKTPTLTECHALTERCATKNSDRAPTTSCYRAVKGWRAYADNDRVELMVRASTRSSAMRALHAALLSLSKEKQ